MNKIERLHTLAEASLEELMRHKIKYRRDGHEREILVQTAYDDKDHDAHSYAV